MSPEKLTGKPLYRKIIDDIASGADSPSKDVDGYRYHVHHTLGELVAQLKFQKFLKFEPDLEYQRLLWELLEAVPNALEYFPEENREDLSEFLKSEGFLNK